MIKQFFKGVSLRKFLLLLAITLVAIVIIAGGVYTGIRTLTRPPTVPTQVRIPMQPPLEQTNPSIESDSEEYYPDENEANDTEEIIVLPPVVYAIMDRKPNFFTFLVFGLDSGNNADVLMVGAFDVNTQSIYSISIPRDTRLDTQRRAGLRKPVVSYSTGRAGGRDHESGVTQMKSDIQTLFGFQPDFYVTIEYDAFVRMVDSVGGVTVTVPFHMRYDDPFDNLRINIPAGTQVLDGERALHFARFRLANSGFRAVTDYQRMEHQQQIIHALFEELLTPRTVLRVPELIGIYRDHVNTNLSYPDKIWFANQFLGMDNPTLSTYTLPMRGTSGAPYWYELVDRNAALELINRTVNPFVQEITVEMVRIL
ncbi:MAG: LCP family protein [Defluviitaleaceae bacterium]|nr:LCP family protein [Defluviitaleaceae bacterium]